MTPYWLGSITSKTAGPMYLFTAKSSANFDKAGVSEMGRMCLLIIVTGFTFISGETLAFFQGRGSFFSANDEFRMSHTGEARKSANSRRSQLFIPSGSPAFLGFKPKRALQTSEELTVKTSVLSWWKTRKRAISLHGLPKSSVDQICNVQVRRVCDPIQE